MLTEFTPETGTDFNALATGLGFLAVVGACLLVTLIVERAWGLFRVEQMNPVAALVRAFFQVVIGTPIAAHLSRMDRVRADAATHERDCIERAHSMARHPSARGHRHLRSVPNRVA